MMQLNDKFIIVSNLLMYHNAKGLDGFSLSSGIMMLPGFLALDSTELIASNLLLNFNLYDLYFLIEEVKIHW